MSKFVLLNTRTFTGGADLTSHSNKISLKPDLDEKDATNFGSQGFYECLGGLKKTEIEGSGQWEAGDSGKVDDRLWADLGAANAISVFPDTANAGDLVYFTNALTCSYALGESVGEVAPWEGKFYGSAPLVRGKGLHPPGTARTATGTGSAVELSAVGSSARLYGGLHVLSVSGTDTPTITVVVQSDVDGSFASPVTALSFAAKTDRGAEFASVAGPITDTFFRVSFTIAGTNPSFLFVVALGVA
jgi:hypothetical protein